MGPTNRVMDFRHLKQFRSQTASIPIIIVIESPIFLLYDGIQRYCISCNFQNDVHVISAFFAISVKSHNTEYTEIITCNIFYRKLLKSQKFTDAN